MKRFFSVLLAVFVFVIGLTGSKTVFAASPFTPGKLAGTYNLISVDDIAKDKKGAIPQNVPRVITVYKGANGEIGIKNSNENRNVLVRVDPKTGKGVVKDGITVRSQGKVTSKRDLVVVFKELGGGRYSFHMLGLNYQKQNTGVTGPAGSSAAKKTDTGKQTADKTVNNKSGQPVEKSGGEGATQTQPAEDTGNEGSAGTDEEEQDDLPESDAGKVGVAVGTALGGGLLGLAGSAVGGATGGGAGGATGSTGGGYGGYGGSDNGSGKNDYEDEYGEEYEDEPDEDYNDEYDEDYEDEPDEDYEGEPGEENEDVSGEDYEDDSSEENEDEYGEDYEDESGEENEDEPGEENEDDSSEENEDDRDDYNDDDRDDREEEREDYEDAVADDSSESEQDDATEAEDKPEPSDDVQNESAADDVPSKENLDNVSVDDDGSLRVTTPTGEEIVYTRNEDGTYNMPTQTETGENLVDENGNAMEPGMVTTQEEILKGAQWYKDNEQAMLAERAEEDARQQAERDRLAAENAKWLEKEREKNSQLSQTSIDLQKELRQMQIDYEHDVLLDKLGMKYGTVEDYVTRNKENIMKAVKREQIRNNIKGGEYEGEAAKWDDRIVTAQEVKFVADQSVMAYSTLTHNQAFANAYNAATNYAETMTDAYVNNKDMEKAFVKATIDTTLDAFSNVLEDKGFHITGNAFAGAYKQVNDNLYNGRDAWEGTDEAAINGAKMGALNKGIGKVVEKSQGTALGTEIGNIGPDTRLDFWNKPKVDAETVGIGKTNLGQEPDVFKPKTDFDQNVHSTKPDVDSNGLRPTSIAEQRMGEGLTKSNIPDAPSGKVNTDMDAGVPKPRTTTDMDAGVPKTRTTTDMDSSAPKPRTTTDMDNAVPKERTDTDNTVSKTRTDTDNATSKTRTDTDSSASKTRTDTDNTASKTRTDTDNSATKTRTDADNTTSKTRTDTDNTSSKTRTDTDNTASKTRTDADNTTSKTRTDTDNTASKTRTETDSSASKTRTDTGVESKKTSIAERRMGKGEYKDQSPKTDAETRAQANEDFQGTVAMNKVRKLHDISKKMDAMEKANPKTYQNDPEYQKLSKQFDSSAREVRENKLSVDRMNLLQGKTGTDLRTRYNKSDIEYEKKVLQYRNESLAEEYGLKPDQIGDLNVTSNKIEEKLAGGKAGHDTDTSPHVKVLSATENDRIKTVDFSQVDGDHHLARAIYKAEHGRYPQTAAEYDEALRLKQLRDFTNVSTRPSDTHESYRNPDAYVGSGKGDVNKVLHPEKYGTPEKGTGVYNQQTAIHKQGTPLERYHQQSAEAQKLREQLKTDTNLSAAEKTEIGKKIQHLDSQSASNHYESVRTTAKEYNVISKINDVNIKNGLKDGLSKDAKQIGEWANKVARGEMEVGEYKKRVTEAYGSEENALKIVAKGFVDTNL